MIFHLITIQNTRTDDTIFHGFDIAALRIQVVTYCRENWPHHITRDNGGMPDDEDILIEAYFYENEREFLIEQEFPLDLPDPNLLSECAEALDVLSSDADEAGYPARAEAATDLAMRCRNAVRQITHPDPEDNATTEGNPDCTACNDGSCPWCQAEKQASEAPLSPLEACKFALSCILDAEEMEEIDEDAFSETKRALRATIAANTV